MKIETKYNIGDTVYFMNSNNNPVLGSISDIQIRIIDKGVDRLAKGRVTMKYFSYDKEKLDVGTDYICETVGGEQIFFPTIKALKENYIKEQEQMFAKFQREEE